MWGKKEYYVGSNGHLNSVTMLLVLLKLKELSLEKS